MNFIDELKEYLNSKTKEEILKDWEESSIECDVPFTLTDQVINKTDDIHSVRPRFFVDLRSGCGAVRDRLHPDFDVDYQGLHNDTIDVVEYRHGFQNSETKSWDMKQEDIDFLNERCASLNGA